MRLAFYTGTTPSADQTTNSQGHVIFGPGTYSSNYFSMASSWSVSLAANVQVGVAVYADNAAAIAGGVEIGGVYRTGDLLKIVH